MVAWDKKYRDKGLVIIGAHTPEFSFEQIKENVVAAAKADNIEYPIVLDNKYALWNAYNNEYWPAKYFIDRN
jgi:alkyl hydroperoxide reductase subunit AhpC